MNIEILNNRVVEDAFDAHQTQLSVLMKLLQPDIKHSNSISLMEYGTPFLDRLANTKPSEILQYR